MSRPCEGWDRCGNACDSCVGVAVPLALRRSTWQCVPPWNPDLGFRAMHLIPPGPGAGSLDRKIEDKNMKAPLFWSSPRGLKCITLFGFFLLLIALGDGAFAQKEPKATPTPTSKSASRTRLIHDRWRRARVALRDVGGGGTAARRLSRRWRLSRRGRWRHWAQALCCHLCHQASQVPGTWAVS